MLNCNYRWSILNYGLFDKLHSQNTDILITLGNTSAKNKGLECKFTYITSKIGFQTMFFMSTLFKK